MSAGCDKPPWKATAVCCLAALACMLLPTEVAARLRAGMHDALRPGQLLLRPLALRLSRVQLPTRTREPVDSNAVAVLRARIARLERQLRSSDVARCRLQDELANADRYGQLPSRPQSTEPLIVHELLTARVLGRERELHGVGGLLIDLGAAAGVSGAAFVVDTDQPVLDVGSDVDVRNGQPVYCGRCVLGRIVHAGRRTSAVQLVTDAGYSGRAQLMRRTAGGPHPGAEGILQGTGDGLCRLRGVPYTEPVAVGDGVYTGGRSARFPQPMYYGRVVRATLEAGARWNILIEPHVNADDVRVVAVLRESLNSTRVLGQ